MIAVTLALVTLAAVLIAICQERTPEPLTQRERLGVDATWTDEPVEWDWPAR